MRTPLPLAALLATTALHAQIVINEVDYDQVGTDNAEYLEIKNVGDAPFPLQYMRVVLINGNNGGAAEYRTIESASWPALQPGNYFVICANEGLTLNCDHSATPATNLIQNGPTDAIALVSVLDSSVWDMVSYGGSVPDFTEGTGTTAQDTNEQDGLSLSRWPDGNDTGNNDADFVIGCPTPGVANELDPVDCALTTGINGYTGDSRLSIIADGNNKLIDVRFERSAAVPVVVSVFAASGSLIAELDLGMTSTAQRTIPVGSGGQLLLVRVQAGNQLMAQRVLLP